MSTRVFISYSHSDRRFVDRLAEGLKTSGLDVWLDRWEIRVGDSITGKINEGIDQAGYLIAVLSRNSVRSKWVRLELNAAMMEELDRKSVFVLPVLIDPCDPSEIPVVIRHKMWADFRENYNQGLQDLLARLVPEERGVGAPILKDPDRPKYERTSWTRKTFLAQSPPELRDRHEELLSWADGQGHVRFGKGKKIATWNLDIELPGGHTRPVLNVYANGRLHPATRGDVAKAELPEDVQEAYLARMEAVASHAEVWEQSYFTLRLGRPEHRQAMMEGLDEVVRALRG